VLLEDLLVPSRVDEGSTYEVKVVARSDEPASGTLRLYRNDEYLGELPVELDGQRARVLSFRQDASTAGLYRYRATLEVDSRSDALPENNQVVATVQVAGAPKILLVERDVPQARHLAQALAAENLAVEVVGPERLPADLAGLRPYAAVILSDIPAFVTTRRQQEALQAYVRDLGRGLMMVGGDESFGLGGWYRSPVETALPVKMDIEDKTRFPKLAMVLSLDKSCSMGGGAGSKLEMAKEAALQTADLLSTRDMLGVVSFDGAASWISPLAELGDRQQVYDDVKAIRPGGGTDIYPSLVTAFDELRKTDASLKHVILLSDGMTEPADFPTLVKAALADSITLSTVGIGTDADSQTMQDLAKWGGGSSYIVTDQNSIPAIFTRETLLATRSFLIEETFDPHLASPSELVRGIAAFPPLDGLVATEVKERATLAMVADVRMTENSKGLPLLAHWRYGLGRSAAFTSDAKGRWGRRWLGTPTYTRFWTQIGRWLAAGGENDSLALESEIREGELIIGVDAVDAAGGFRNFLDGEVRIVAPDLQVHALPLRQVAPGRYEARMPVDQDGSWMIGAQLLDGDDVVGQAVGEAVQSYSPEFRARTGAGHALLEEIGRVGGGGLLTDPAAVFARPEVRREVPRPLWPILMAISAFLLLLDVANRRLDLSFDRRAQAVAATGGATARLAWRFGQPPAAPASGAPKSAGGEVTELVPDEPSAAPPKVEVPPESYAGRLLAARKKARDKIDDR
jgi:Ca-activated chloride channel family protein